MNDKLFKLKIQLLEQIQNLSDSVDEAYEIQEGMWSGERDFGHAGDAFEGGWDNGVKVGQYDKLTEVLNAIEELIEE